MLYDGSVVWTRILVSIQFSWKHSLVHGQVV